MCGKVRTSVVVYPLPAYLIYLHEIRVSSHPRIKRHQTPYIITSAHSKKEKIDADARKQKMNNAVRNFFLSRVYYGYRTPICGLGKPVIETYLNQVFPHGHIVVKLECSIPRRLTSEEENWLEKLRAGNDPAEYQNDRGAGHGKVNGDPESDGQQQAKEKEYLC
ncbi:hypothetical protein CSAL01_00005 [Colletotrichum salicis]|uniref:Uncharacterized protein n=1 Tax=Colletotrichum salicis TaxID=1209931 RepID=A0A135UTQ5_9PEZI|nr:hypothetical protein CSAL01_00005 [Colletotrichum salicis]